MESCGLETTTRAAALVAASATSGDSNTTDAAVPARSVAYRLEAQKLSWPDLARSSDATLLMLADASP